VAALIGRTTVVVASTGIASALESISKAIADSGGGVLDTASSVGAKI
jgi:hypothetical protein